MPENRLRQRQHADEAQAAENGDAGETAQESAAPSTAHRRPSIESATFFTTMVDFAEPGELGVFIDEEQLALVEESMKDKGYFDGAKMAEAFNLLRANDLIWSFVINNYLMGKDPFPFDLLYWNSDSTRMPREMHSAYLRDMYQDNRLREPGGITLDGVPIDLSSIDAPVYILSTREDHIAPWKSTYAATRLYSGPIRFVLAMSGHIAGVVNPPSANKYGYFTCEVAETPDAWLESATAHEGSWWPDWDAWVSEHDDGEAAGTRAGRRRPAGHRGRSRALRQGADRVDRADGKYGGAVPRTPRCPPALCMIPAGGHRPLPESPR